MITLQSFGYAFGLVEGFRPGDVIVDCRVFKNPHYITELRKKTGMDTVVQQWMWQDKRFATKLNDLLADTKDGSKVMFGCYGGRHRSVAMVELLGRWLNRAGYEIDIRHRELHQQYVLKVAKIG